MGGMQRTVKKGTYRPYGNSNHDPCAGVLLLLFFGCWGCAALRRILLNFASKIGARSMLWGQGVLKFVSSSHRPTITVDWCEPTFSLTRYESIKIILLASMSLWLPHLSRLFKELTFKFMLKTFVGDLITSLTEAVSVHRSLLDWGWQWSHMVDTFGVVKGKCRDHWM